MNKLLQFLLFPHTCFDGAEINAKIKNKLQNKTILITGASFGIGEATAYLLAANGANLILIGRTTEKLREISEDINQKNGGKALFFTCDFCDEKQVDALCCSLAELPQTIDIVISNAGKSLNRSVFDSVSRPQDFTKTMAINYHAPVKIILRLLPLLKNKNAQIINMSAVNVLLAPPPKWAAYQASKTAFDQWLRCIAPELAAFDIAVTAFYLPLVKTRMIAPTKIYENLPAMNVEQVAALVAKSILTRPHRIAPWWLFLGQLGSILFAYPLDWIFKKLLKKYQ